MVVEGPENNQADNSPCESEEGDPPDMFPKPAEPAVVACIQSARLPRLDILAGAVGAERTQPGLPHGPEMLRGGGLRALGTNLEGDLRV